MHKCMQTYIKYIIIWPHVRLFAIFYSQDYQKEHLKQAFYQCKLNQGTITAKDFSTIMKTCRAHVLSPYVHEHLLTVQYFCCCVRFNICRSVHIWATGGNLRYVIYTTVLLSKLKANKNAEDDAQEYLRICYVSNFLIECIAYPRILILI